MNSAIASDVPHWKLGSHLAIVLLLFSVLAPLASHYLGLPDVSGAEAVLALAFWAVAVVSNRRLYMLDVLGLLFIAWLAVGAVASARPASAVLLEASLYLVPLCVLRLVREAPGATREALGRTLLIVSVLQLFMFCLQLVTREGVDDLKGSFVGTQYGEHVSSFILLVGIVTYICLHPKRRRVYLFLVVGFISAYLADAKTALAFVTISLGLFIVLGRRSGRSNLRLPPAGRILIAATLFPLSYLFYIGAFGNIALASYVEQTQSSQGGKPAVAREFINLGGGFWSQNSIFVGAGPAQTVSRTAELTIANRLQDEAPAARLGIPPAEYFHHFVRLAEGRSYIGGSSATNAASSALGLLGDTGLVGVAIYLMAFILIGRHYGATLGTRSWMVLCWFTLLVPGILGEWLEFPPVMIFIVLCMHYLATHRVEAVGGHSQLP